MFKPSLLTVCQDLNNQENRSIYGLDINCGQWSIDNQYLMIFLGLNYLLIISRLLKNIDYLLIVEIYQLVITCLSIIYRLSLYTYLKLLETASFQSLKSLISERPVSNVYQ